MVEEKRTLDDLKDLAAPSAAEEVIPAVAEPELDDLGRAYATGKRKKRDRSSLGKKRFR